MGFTIKSFDQIVTDTVAQVVSGSPAVTDLTPGSVLRSLIEGMALAVEEVYVQGFLGFRRGLEEVAEDAFAFTRKSGVKSTTNVIFSRTGTTGTVAIPLGTRVSTVAGLEFVTTAAGSILNGFTSSASIPIEASAVGISFNVAGGSITVIVDPIDGVETVTNALAAVGGVDAESDFAFTQRFQAFIEGLGRSNIAGLKAGALSVEGITSVTVEELFPPVANVNANVYVDDQTTVGVSAAKILEVQKVIDGDRTEDNPGYRSAGVNVVVKAPAIVSVNVTINVTPEVGIDFTATKTRVETAITNYVNTLGVGADVIANEIITAAHGVNGVVDTVLTAPPGNVVITPAQVGRIGTLTVTIV